MILRELLDTCTQKKIYVRYNQYLYILYDELFIFMRSKLRRSARRSFMSSGAVFQAHPLYREFLFGKG